MKFVVYEQDVDTFSVISICTEDTLIKCVAKLSLKFKEAIEKDNPNSQVWILPATIGVMVDNCNPEQWYFYNINIGCQIVTKMDKPLEEELDKLNANRLVGLQDKMNAIIEERKDIHQQYTIQEISDSFVLL